MKTNVFKVLYDTEADSAILVHNGTSLPTVICGSDESFRGLRMDGREIAELFDQFVYGGGVKMPGDLESMSLLHTNEWLKKSLSQCALSIKTAYRLATEFAKVAGPTDQDVFFKAASYAKLLEFNKGLADLVSEVSESKSRQATTPTYVLELLESAAENNEWNISLALDEVRRELSLKVTDRSGMSV